MTTNWIYSMTGLTPPAHYVVEASDNLATDSFALNNSWTAQTALTACSPNQEVVAMDSSAVSVQPPYSIPLSGSNYSFEPQGTPPSFLDDSHYLRDHAVPPFAYQLNLATSSNSSEGMGLGTTQHEYPSELRQAIGRTVYEPYGSNSTFTQVGCSEAPTLPGISYVYTSYPGRNRPRLFNAEQRYHPAVTFSERNTAGMLMDKRGPQSSVTLGLEGTPLDKDTWTSFASSSPSLASLSSSPASLQRDQSALGTPYSGFEDSPVLQEQPLPSYPVAYPISSLDYYSDGPVRRRVFSSNRGTVINTRTIPSQAIPTGSQLLVGTQVTSVSTESPNSSRQGETARRPASNNTSLRVERLTRGTSSKSVHGYEQSRKDRHHPYGRSQNMTAHEQLIDFGTSATTISSASNSDSKKTKGQKSQGSIERGRVDCKYVCPLKKVTCGQSMSRPADLQRHMQRHRRAEKTMVSNGLLSPDEQTKFENLKADETTLCKGCKKSLSRIDALLRHLKSGSGACRRHYPKLTISD